MAYINGNYAAMNANVNVTAEDVDLSGYVLKTLTIAGVDLANDITADELATALNTYPIIFYNGAPTTATKGAAGQLYFDEINQNLYICISKTAAKYNWYNLTASGVDVDLSKYVLKTLTIAGIDLQNNITAEELQEALNVFPIEVNYGATTPTSENVGQLEYCASGFNRGLYVLIEKENGESGIEETRIQLMTSDDAPVKGVDYFTDADKAEIVTDVTENLNANGLSQYWLSHLASKVDTIRQAMENAGRNKSAFLFYSDSHFNYGAQKAPALLKHLYEHTPINKTIFGGDIVNNEPTEETIDDRTIMSYLWDWRNVLRGLPNHHSVVGNHDDGNATNNIFSSNYIYAYLLAAEENAQGVYGDGLYYYIDDNSEKTRYLYLDTAYKGVDDKQLAFIKEALSSTLDGWHIVVVSHIWYEPDYDQYDVRPIPIVGLSTDASKVVTELDEYNSRQGDYAECGGWVEFCVGGHVHIDYDGTTDTGIPIILVETDSYHTRSGLSATAGTINESSVNAIVANYDEHKISVIRIGRGESREVEITNYPISYTNVLTLAVDTDGTPFQGGKGYAENSRMGSSGLYIGTVNGVDCTGFIPIDPSVDQVVRFKNVTMNTDSANANYLALGVYSESFARLNLLSMANFIDSTNGSRFNLVLDGNNIKQITLPKSDISAGTKYLVICCDDINDASVITINEPI